jgi:hypothetical protein
VENHTRIFSPQASSVTRTRSLDFPVTCFIACKVSSCERWSKLTICRYQNTRKLSNLAFQLRSLRRASVAALAVASGSPLPAPGVGSARIHD